MNDQLNIKEKSYLIQLDGIRAIAVLMVMISHFFSYEAVVLIPFGSMGVNIFFVLSGFLITRILLIAKAEVEIGNKTLWQSFLTFYYRRTLRIFPIYYLIIALLYIKNLPPTREVSFWLYSYLMNIKFAMPGVWESRLFGHFDHFWSLCVEEQFYLFFPLIVFFIPKNFIRNFFIILVFTGLLSRLLLYMFDAPKNSIYVLTPTCLDAFGVGALLAFFFLYDDLFLYKLLNLKKVFVLLLTLFVIDIIYSRLFIQNYGECRTVLERFIFCLCCFFIVGYATLGSYTGAFQKFLQHPQILYIGKISYGLYVYHNFIPYLYYPIVNRISHVGVVEILNNQAIRGILYICLTIIVATISWYLVESPINKLKNKKISNAK